MIPTSADSWKCIALSAWKRQRLRQKLTVGVWVCILPFSLAGSGIALWRAQRGVIQEWERRALRDADVINSVGQAWGNQILSVLESTANDQPFRSLKQTSMSNTLRQIQHSWPNYNFAVFNPKGETLAIAQADRKKNQGFSLGAIEIRKQEWFHAAIAGISDSWLTADSKRKIPYAFGSVPIYDPKEGRNRKPIAILVSQIRLSEFDESSRLKYLFVSTENAQPIREELIDLDTGKQRGIAALIILQPVGVHFIGQRTMSDQYRNNMLNSSYAMQSRWRPVIEAGLQPGPSSEAKELRIGAIDYLLALKRNEGGGVIALISDKQTILQNVNLLFASFVLINLATLVLSSIAIYRICAALSKPFDLAGDALAAISQGDFSARLPEETSDVGRLFSHINNASQQLKAYLAASMQHAVTESQLTEARRLQSNFLVKDIPDLSEIELAASFDPAYEIGADWYDTILLGKTLYMVVADVCDKGIPSALYMSVFRSLLRNNIINNHVDTSNRAEIIKKSLSDVNRYMAQNHGSTSMFATIFLASYELLSQRLDYIVAGHESPLFLCGAKIKRLELGGPAVGLFTESTYTPSVCQMAAGSILLAFSDGLPDARNPEESQFGIKHIEQILQERESDQWTASDLIERLQEAVFKHQGDAEQFDDLTLMAVKIKNPF